MSFQFLKNQEIDFTKWDAAIASCYNENPYAYSTWLNMVSPGWGGVINEDYSLLMPVPLKKKAGINYISQPRFTQQLGIFSLTPLQKGILKEMLAVASKGFLKAHLQLNIENGNDEAVDDLKSRITCILPLQAHYAELYENFSSHHKRNIIKAIKIAEEKNFIISESKDHKLFFELFKEIAPQKDKNLNAGDLDLINIILSSGYGKMLICLSPSGEVLSGLFYLKSQTKLVNLFNFNQTEGVQNKTMYLLLNHWIKTYAESTLTLDFEGSEIANLARFYQGFGASAHPYHLFTKKGFW